MQTVSWSESCTLNIHVSRLIGNVDQAHTCHRWKLYWIICNFRQSRVNLFRRWLFHLIRFLIRRSFVRIDVDITIRNRRATNVGLHSAYSQECHYCTSIKRYQYQWDRSKCEFQLFIDALFCSFASTSMNFCTKSISKLVHLSCVKATKRIVPLNVPAIAIVWINVHELWHRVSFSFQREWGWRRDGEWFE